jgi:hypothetical protein
MFAHGIPFSSVGAVSRMIFIIPVVAFAAVTLAAGCAWWFMTKRAEKWCQFVTQENDFWREKGLISSLTAERLKRWEKGGGMKVLAVVVMFFGLIGLTLTLTALIKAERVEHQKLRMPYDPVLQKRLVKPVKK